MEKISMNEETKKLLLDCKKVGYQFISIGIQDGRVLSSMKITTSYGGYWNDEKTGRPRVVCAEPKIRPNGKPAIWTIIEKSPLSAGMLHKGCGCGETHNVRCDHNLELGVYDLSKIE
jgi:hypothetical protein